MIAAMSTRSRISPAQRSGVPFEPMEGRHPALCELKAYARNRLRPQPNRAEVAGALASRPGSLSGGSKLQRAQILRGRNASVSQWSSAYGARTQLHHWRRAGAIHVDARL